MWNMLQPPRGMSHLTMSSLLFGQPWVLSICCPNNIYPSFHLGAVGPCGWRWRACSSSKRSADCGEDGLQLGHGNASCQTEPHGTTRQRQAEPVPAGSSEPGRAAGTRWATADAVQRPQRWVKLPCPVSCEACPCRLSFWFGDSFCVWWFLLFSCFSAFNIF